MKEIFIVPSILTTEVSLVDFPAIGEGNIIVRMDTSGEVVREEINLGDITSMENEVVVSEEVEAVEEVVVLADTEELESSQEPEVLVESAEDVVVENAEVVEEEVSVEVAEEVEIELAEVAEEVIEELEAAGEEIENSEVVETEELVPDVIALLNTSLESLTAKVEALTSLFEQFVITMNEKVPAVVEVSVEAAAETEVENASSEEVVVEVAEEIEHKVSLRKAPVHVEAEEVSEAEPVEIRRVDAGINAYDASNQVRDRIKNILSELYS